MSNFETTSITVPYRRSCEDRVAVIEVEDGVVIAAADGAGGTGAGDQAAETVIREITTAASLEFAADDWCSLLRQIDCRIGAGESTGVVVALTPKTVVGASVGDSKAWIIEDGELVDLTSAQGRKPLLGSGAAEPVGFRSGPLRGLLLVATDGFCNYVRRETLLKEIAWIDFAVLARRLVEMVRLPSGELWDDIGLVACRPRRKMAGRKRYDLTDAD
jgi:hypothetical protein